MRHDIYQESKLEILNKTDDWQKRMDLTHYVINHNFLNILCDDESVIAETATNWQYREANINWYMDKVVTLGERALERTIVHELTHILTAPMEDNIKRGREEFAELAVEGIARAFIVMRYGSL